jgi:phosphate transport system permease protein
VVFLVTSLFLLFFVLLSVGALLLDILIDGVPRLTWSFLSDYPSRFPGKAGVLAALAGSLALLGLTAVIAFPIGLGAAIYLEEFTQVGGESESRLLRLIEVNLNSLAAVPSIIFGLLGLAVFVRYLALGPSLLAGALTLSLLILPLIIIAAREALRAVPSSVREASLALGATQWQTVWHQVLPLAFPGVLTGTILALSRAVGETAPLIAIGAVAYVSFLPDSVLAPFSALPVQTFTWITRPQAGFQVNAAAAITVLLPILLGLNAIAIWMRNRFRSNSK